MPAKSTTVTAPFGAILVTYVWPVTDWYVVWYTVPSGATRAPSNGSPVTCMGVMPRWGEHEYVGGRDAGIDLLDGLNRRPVRRNRTPSFAGSPATA